MLALPASAPIITWYCLRQVWSSIDISSPTLRRAVVWTFPKLWRRLVPMASLGSIWWKDAMTWGRTLSCSRCFARQTAIKIWFFSVKQRVFVLLGFFSFSSGVWNCQQPSRGGRKHVFFANENLQSGPPVAVQRVGGVVRGHPAHRVVFDRKTPAGKWCLNQASVVWCLRVRPATSENLESACAISLRDDFRFSRAASFANCVGHVGLPFYKTAIKSNARLKSSYFDWRWY